MVVSIKDVVEISLKAFSSSQPPVDHKPDCVRHLVLPVHALYDVASLERINSCMRNTFPKQRPNAIAITRTMPGRAYDDERTHHRRLELAVEFLNLCKDNLKSLKMESAESTSDLIHTDLLDATIPILRNLSTLDLRWMDLCAAPLVQIFSSKRCKIRSLILESAFQEEHLIQIMETYDGLEKLVVSTINLNDFDGETDCLLATIPTTPNRLTHLHIRGYVFDQNQLSLIASTLKAQNGLLVLEVQNNFLFLQRNEDNGSCSPVGTTEHTERFTGAVATHPSLEELVLIDACLSNSVLTSLLAAAAMNPRLRLLNIICKWSTRRGELPRCRPHEFDSSGEWVQLLPQLKNMQSFLGLSQHLGDKPEWKTVVLPWLRQNASLVELCYSGDNYMCPCLAKSECGKEEALDMTTRQILARNKLLRVTAPFWQAADPSHLALWPFILEQLAAEEVERSALYNFLCKMASELP